MRSTSTLHCLREALADDVRGFDKATALAAASGIVTGLAFAAVIPAAQTLGGAETVLGLGFWQWIAVLAVLAVAAGVIDYFKSTIAYNSALDFLGIALHGIGDKIASLPLGWFGKGTAGRLSRFVTHDLMSIGQSFAHLIAPIVVGVSSIITLCIATLLWDWRIGLTLIIPLPLLWGASKLSARLLHRGSDAMLDLDFEASSRLVEFAICQGALRSCGASHPYRPLDDALEARTAGQRRSLRYSVAANLVSNMAGQLLPVAMIVVCTALTLQGSLSLLAGIACMGVALRFSTTVVEMFSMLLGVEESRKALDYYLSVMREKPLPEPAESHPVARPGEVELEHVRFGYDDTATVLDDVSWKAEPGSMIAIVGPSGSGKTTMAKLIARFYDVNAGTVRVGGVDVRDQRAADVLAQRSMVFQDGYLFQGTLVDNIRLGRPEASDDEVMRAAELAGVSEIADRLPGGWHTNVGEGGRALSGGERQRVSIARAVLKQAPIVLFDEATSALDVENEAHINDCMAQIRATSTVIVIAHKLETIRNADLIVVMGDDGLITQRGTHSELIGQDGTYREFYEARCQAETWSL
ncbi:ABC transporter ATP-binding protein [Bifidobacterium merycicum]